MQRLSALTALLCLCLGSATAGDDGFKPMLNGKDLTGWHNVNCAPGTFYVKDNMIITTGKPTGYLRTERHYENFIAEFEWLHAPSKKGEVGNSGFFVWCDPLPAVGTGYSRGIEVQVLVNLEWKDKKTGKSTATSHGDLFSIWGATCVPDREHPLGWARSIPSENRAKGEHEWNHYRVEAIDGVIKLAVNGKFVSMVSKCNPRKGYLALESEGSECRFKNLKIKELPSTNPKASEICEVDKGFKCMFTGLDLTGWKGSDHWKMNDGVLTCGKWTAKDPHLQSDKAYGDFEFVCDWRGKKELLMVRGNEKSIVPLIVPSNMGGKPGDWNRSLIRMKGDQLTVHINGKILYENQKIGGIPASGAIAFQNREGLQVRNVFIRELKADN